LEALSERVIGAAIRVHGALGPGLLESVYELALAEELRESGLGFERQKPVPIRYRGLILDNGLRLDFVVEDQIVLELKSVERILDVHRAQLLTYMKLSGCKVGLLLNFNVPRMKHGIHRFVHEAPD
jgi:GxxExxY protein